MRKTSKRLYNDNKGTEKHKERKQKMRKTSKRLYNDIEGTDKHKERKQKMRKTSRFIKLVPNLAILREFSVRAML